MEKDPEQTVRIEGRDRSEPPRDDLGAAIRAGADVDPIEARMAMQRVRASLTRATIAEDPVRIGRHLVVRKIAAGGFGVVYEAYDPELDRRLAVKVLRTDGAASDGTGGMLLEEARALAKVSHPNVVAVFDVGVLPSPGGPARIFLAMEMVGGESLRDWLEREQPGWRAVVERFRAAGEGLAAAHEAGIVHRDFKPANVLLGDDGRVRVADFGLAIASESAEDAPVRERGPSGSASGGESGTPAYMAPEQHRGELGDVRTDVYSFCVSLYQGLYGQLPFMGETTRALRRLKQEPPTIPKDGRVPGWLRQVLVQGLQPRLEDRTPSMRLLLDELDRHLSSRRRTAVGLGAVAIAAVGLGYGLGSEPSPATAAVDPCVLEAQQAMAGVWEADGVQASRAAFEATGLTYADTAWQTTSRALETYLERWQGRRQELCEARPFLERNAPQLLEHRRACLDDRLHEVEALVAELGAADPTTVQHSVRAVHGLDPPDTCTEETLTRSATLPEDELERRRLDDIRVRLARLRMLRSFGRYDRLPPLVDSLREELSALDYVPLLAELRLELGFALVATGQGTEAEAMIQQGVRSAEAAGMMQLTARGKAYLIWLVGHELGRPDEGMVWAHNTDSAIAAARTAGLDTRRLEASYHAGLGALYFSRGKYEEAWEAYERTRALNEEVDGVEHPSTIRTLGNQGSLRFAKGDLEEAEQLFQRALEYREQTLGVEHPDTVTMLANLGAVAQESGRHQHAKEIAEHVLRSRQAVQGPDHVVTARAHYQLGVSLARLGELPEAREHYERALRGLRSAVGEDHPDIAFYSNGLAALIQRQGQLEEAEALYREALEHVESHLGADHPNAALTLVNLGSCLRVQGRLGEAEASHREALRILDEIDPDHPRSVNSRIDLALALIEMDRAAEALPLLDHAREITRAHGGSAERLALIDMTLGMARWELGDDRDQARALVEAAADRFSEDSGFDSEGTEARAWLLAHPAP